MQQTALMTVRLLLLVSQLMAGCLGQYSIGNGGIASGLDYNDEIGPSSSLMGREGGYRPGYGSGYGHGLGYDRYGHAVGYGGTYETAYGYGPGLGYGATYGGQSGLGYSGGFNPVLGYGTSVGGSASATGLAGGYGSTGPGLGHNSGPGFLNDASVGRYPADLPSYPYTWIHPTMIAGPAIAPAQTQAQSTSNKNTNTNTNTNINISNKFGKRRRGSLTRELLGMPQLF